MKPKIWRRDWSRRAVSLLLALALLASLLPGTVTAASGEDITAAKEANLAYYERKSEYSPLTALAVYALTRDSGQTAGILLQADFVGDGTAYSSGSSVKLGSGEAMAAIDVMARGRTPGSTISGTTGSLQRPLLI